MKKAPINWVNLIFLSVTPLVALTLVPYYAVTVGFTAYEWAWFAFYLIAGGLGITAGYHRFWSHRAYDAHWSVRLWHAVWGASSIQNSILVWSSDHRSHHRYVDQPEKDPYAATKGFWFSHIGWILRDYPRVSEDFDNVKDLQRDPIVRWQHRNYLAIVIAVNGVVPLLLGFLHGRLFGVFLLAFVLRLVVNHHLTFLINSLAHRWGWRPYSEDDTSRDNPLLSLATYGEGYHNFHHAFQYDYRNGVRWWHFDPTKWTIRACAWLGLAKNLRRAAKEQIEMARAKMQLRRAVAKLTADNEASHLRERIEHAYAQFIAALTEWTQFKKQWAQIKQASAERWEKNELGARYAALKRQLKGRRRQWRLALAALAGQ